MGLAEGLPQCARPEAAGPRFGWALFLDGQLERLAAVAKLVAHPYPRGLLAQLPEGLSDQLPASPLERPVGALVDLDHQRPCDISPWRRRGETDGREHP